MYRVACKICCIIFTDIMYNRRDIRRINAVKCICAGSCLEGSTEAEVVGSLV